MRLKRHFWLGLGLIALGVVPIILATGNTLAHGAGALLVISGVLVAARSYRS